MRKAALWQAVCFILESSARKLLTADAAFAILAQTLLFYQAASIQAQGVWLHVLH